MTEIHDDNTANYKDTVKIATFEDLDKIYKEIESIAKVVERLIKKEDYTDDFIASWEDPRKSRLKVYDSYVEEQKHNIVKWTKTDFCVLAVVVGSIVFGLTLGLYVISHYFM